MSLTQSAQNLAKTAAALARPTSSYGWRMSFPQLAQDLTKDAPTFVRLAFKYLDRGECCFGSQRRPWTNSAAAFMRPTFIHSGKMSFPEEAAACIQSRQTLFPQQRAQDAPGQGAAAFARLAVFCPCQGKLAACASQATSFFRSRSPCSAQTSLAQTAGRLPRKVAVAQPARHLAKEASCLQALYLCA